ncbi:transcriptional repressor AgaR [Pedobacter immunditicola]|uniref:transcriptional repressor AgaR n=1 Tax=Pedobacter immunditicola TaxID=3133440 RepID=UPI0030B33A86
MSLEKKTTTTERRVLILQKLNLNGQVNVTNLSEELEVSEVTIRNDLNKLEKKKMLVRTRGGAINISRVGLDFNISEKKALYFEEKKKIGEAAAKLIEEGDTIILDSGSTTKEIIKHLDSFASLTIITNAINIANELAEMKNVNVIIPGGILRKNSLSLVGSTAEENFQNYFCDKLFLAVDGFNTTHGLSTPNVEEAHLNRVMIEIARKVIVVTDSSKFSKRSFAVIAPISKVDIVVTDSGIKAQDQKDLEDSGTIVVIA